MLEEIYNNQVKISELNAEIKRLETETAALMEDAVSQEVKKEGNYRLTLAKDRTTRTPIKGIIMAVIGRDAALECASFTIKDLESKYTKEQVNGWCAIHVTPGKLVVTVEGE